VTQWEAAGPDPGLKGVSSIREPSRAERAAGRRAAETRATIPDLELVAEVDAEPALGVCEATGWALTAVLVRACAAALREHPRANAAYRDGRFELYSRVNVAVTVATDQGPVAPTILDADTKPVAEIDAELARLTARAQNGALTPPELAGATFTLTDLGADGLARASALITPPQAAALVAGAARRVPVIRGDSVVPGSTICLTLGCDSRILFGTPATRFLTAIAAELESVRP
jgi:pyruvate dehydrogenase E2 component (dihydrolipoamide acetyltransferase)